MTFAVRVTGGRELRDVARALRKAGREDLIKELRTGMSRATAPLRQRIRDNVPRTMPSGYAPVLGGALNLRTDTRTSGSSVGVTVTVRAKGKAEDRDLPALDDGRLKHPVYGRYRRTHRGRKANPWVTQRVRPGLVSDPARQLAADTIREAQAAVDRVADMIEGG